LPSAEKLAQLREVNARVEAAPMRSAPWTLDDAWHMMLVEDCGNPFLLELIAGFMRQTRRYELALMRERREVLAAGANHRAVLAALRRRDLDGACEALHHNLMRGAAPIVAWLRARVAKGAAL